MADGVPTPTITWKRADGTEVRKVTAAENVVGLEMKNNQDFGQYTCEAKNDVGPADTQTVEVKQISKRDIDPFFFTKNIYWTGAPLACSNDQCI